MDRRAARNGILGAITGDVDHHAPEIAKRDGRTRLPIEVTIETHPGHQPIATPLRQNISNTLPEYESLVIVMML